MDAELRNCTGYAEHLIAAGEKAGFRALRMALQVGSEEWGVVNRVCTLLLATSCRDRDS